MFENCNDRVRVDVALSNEANDGWFTPGAGCDVWFQDGADGPEMVVVPGGTFTMGSSPEEIAKLANAYPNGTTGVYPDDTDWWETEGPERTVTIARSFAVSRFAISRGAFSTFVQDTGYAPEKGAYRWDGKAFYRDLELSWRAPGFDQADDHPVVCINWHDARAYTQWLSAKTSRSYRLLSEAEHEYVTRAGTRSQFWFRAGISPSVANYDGNHAFYGGETGVYRKATLPVETFEPNPWGLYQVHGNVWEWCEDLWNDSHQGAPMDGRARTRSNGHEDNSRRVIRGGSWVLSPQLLRSANRLFNPENERSHDLGFRVARDF